MAPVIRIGIDCDGVIADFCSAYARLLVTTTGHNHLPWDPFTTPAPLDKLVTWNWEAHYGYTPEDIDHTWDLINDDPRFWMHLDELPGCAALRRAMGILLTHHEVYFITARTGQFPKWQTENWLVDHLDIDYPPTVIISKEKGLVARALCLDAYIDDRWENCFDVANIYPPCRTYLLDAPYNHSNVPLSVIRIPTLDHMLIRENLYLPQPVPM